LAQREQDFIDMSTRFQKGHKPWNTGKTRPAFSDEWKEKMSLSGKGRKKTDETKKKISESHKGMKKPWAKPPIKIGKDNNKWKGGVTPIHHKIRTSKEYKIWRKAVFERDGYKCIWCGVIGNGKNLNADHIKPFALYPELRLAIDNGRTLCISCHRTTDTYGNKKKYE
jgi:5-methylcytosine-specific restriction endonuclease McrA